MPQVVFLTLFLGLTAGLQTVELRVDPQVQSVRLELGGRALATIEHAPWSARVDFGPDLIPQDLVAIGFDARGAEVTRASQTLNLPRPVAEVEIAISQSAKPVVVELIGRHRTHSQPKLATLSIDGAALGISKDFRVNLPQLDWSRPHVLSAEMRFADGQVARREVVLNGGFSDAVESEVTPVLVTLKGKQQPKNLEACFTANGAALRTSALEMTSALVTLVKDPDATAVRSKLHPVMEGTAQWNRKAAGWEARLQEPITEGLKEWWSSRALPLELRLDGDTTEKILWPVSKQFGAAGEPTYQLFEPSNEVEASKAGMSWLLTRQVTPPPPPAQPRQFADAVAVAGVAALNRGTRRAVVLLLGSTPDASSNTPASVRRYLETIGVPLFVWSVEGPRPDLADSWGAVDDISTTRGLENAVAKLERAVVEQRIAWVSTDALSALTIEGNDACGLKPVARTLATR